jgi:uncharacterized protein (DUF302 family)
MKDDLTVDVSTKSVPDTVKKLLALLNERGIEVFSVIDHAAGAAQAELELDDEVVVIFGAPAVGTKLMQSDRRAGLDLPLRMLIWRENGTTWVGYRDPHVLADLYRLETLGPVLEGMAHLLEQLAEKICQN